MNQGCLGKCLQKQALFSLVLRTRNISCSSLFVDKSITWPFIIPPQHRQLLPIPSLKEKGRDWGMTVPLVLFLVWNNLLD